MILLRRSQKSQRALQSLDQPYIKVRSFPILAASLTACNMAVAESRPKLFRPAHHGITKTGQEVVRS